MQLLQQIFLNRHSTSKQNTMKCIYFTAIFLILLQNSTANVAKGKQETRWLKYYEKTQKMLCGPPQKRALPVTQFRRLIDPNAISDLELETFFPKWVVVNRCKNSGCCKKFGDVCVPVKKDVKNLWFMYKRGRKKLFYSLRVENHVRCACQSFKAVAKSESFSF